MWRHLDYHRECVLQQSETELRFSCKWLKVPPVNFLTECLDPNCSASSALVWYWRFHMKLNKSLIIIVHVLYQSQNLNQCEADRFSSPLLPSSFSSVAASWPSSHFPVTKQSLMEFSIWKEVFKFHFNMFFVLVSYQQHIENLWFL